MRIGTGIFVLNVTGNNERTIRQFSRKVKDSKLILEIKDRKFFEKPSAKKRKKRSAAKARARRENQNQKNY